jgi:hypothetical protein
MVLARTGGEKFGVIPSLLQKGSILGLLVLHRFDEGAKGLVRCTDFQLFDGEGLPDGAGQFDWLIGLGGQ